MLLKCKTLLLLNKIIFSVGLIFFVSVIAQPAKAQIVGNETKITLNVADMPLLKVLEALETQSSCRFAYQSELITRQKNITIAIHEQPFEEVLHQLFDSLGIRYRIINNQVILQQIQGSQKFTCSGFIRDAQTGELLVAASIYLPSLHAGISANNYGFFSCTIPSQDSLDLIFSYVGYKTVYETLKADSPQVLNIRMHRVTNQASQIIFSFNRNEDYIKKTQAGMADLSRKTIDGNPSVIGTGDILLTLQTVPGVQAGLDGNSGYFVRGGNADQNLILLDEATIYNPSHLLNPLSIFNSAAMKHARLFKGSFPAAYGDHLSSVLEISIKDGSKEHFSGDVELGSLISGLSTLR